eukprot:GHVS01025371.1.p1 GENE.GHVS01025371.1~~GHVS01025371.1.p1  ORF type:complete len:374 (+),score=45.07 GHVS01025371.1:51-1172(+)
MCSSSPPTLAVTELCDAEADLHSLLSMSQLFAEPGMFQQGQTTVDYLHGECKVLVIGAGGLGCEVLKDLALTGFRDIHLIDMDTVQTSNLNRQFLFRDTDIGQSKAVVAADVLNKRFRSFGLQVTPHFSKIQTFDASFYSQFSIIIGGLDSISSRRWINSLLHEMVEVDAATRQPIPGSLKPFLDGGTEGLKGQSRVIIPTLTSCFDCSLDTLPQQITYPLCTIAETPRQPEHCIEYAMLVSWPRIFPGKSMDADNPEDIEWLRKVAEERAIAFGISATITTSFALGVAKRIVPAVASTNAFIAASLVQEALKLATYMGPVLNNYFMYMGDSGIYTCTFDFAKNDVCPFSVTTTPITFAAQVVFGVQRHSCAA